MIDPKGLQGDAQDPPGGDAQDFPDSDAQDSLEDPPAPLGDGDIEIDNPWRRRLGSKNPRSCECPGRSINHANQHPRNVTPQPNPQT
jgi:hypothetical protein